MMRLPIRTFVMLVAAVLAVSSLAQAQRAESPDVLLRQAADKAAVDSDLPAAIKLYETVVSRFSKTNPAAAATALLGIADCYQKQGNAQAKATLEKLIRDFGSQSAQVAEARTRLAALGARSSSPPASEWLICANDGRNGCGSRGGVITPDGRYLVMGGAVWKGALGRRDMATGEVVRLAATSTPPPPSTRVGADGIAISRDGKQIAYHWSDGQTELRLVGNDTAAVPRTLFKSADVAVVPVAWTTDRRILVRVRRQDRSVDLAWVSSTDGSMKVIRSLGWRMRGESGLPEVSLSPDERFIAFSALASAPATAPQEPTTLRLFSTAEQHLYVIAADGSGQETELTNTRGIDHNPIWSRDGKYLLFSRNRSDSADLFALPMRGSQAAGFAFRVKPDIGTFFNMGITNDGHLYFWQLHPSMQEVVVADLDVSGPLPASPHVIQQFSGRLPSWSPDGRFLAVSSIAPVSATQHTVTVYAFDKTEDRRFQMPQSPDKPAIWRPDSSGFLQVTRAQGEDKNWLAIDLKQGTVTALTGMSDPLFFNVPVIARDGRTMYRLGGPRNDKGEFDQIVAVDLQTRQERAVFNLPQHQGSAGGPALSPDGRTLAFAWRTAVDAPTRLGVVGTEGSGFREIRADLPGWNGMHWTRNGRSLIVAVSDTGANRSPCGLVRIDLTGGKPERVGLEFMPGNIVCDSTFSINPAGTRVAYQVMQSAQELRAIDVTEPALLKRSR